MPLTKKQMQLTKEQVIKKMNKIKDRFEWAKCQDNLSREDMLDQLQEDILTIISNQNS